MQIITDSNGKVVVINGDALNVVNSYTSTNFPFNYTGQSGTNNISIDGFSDYGINDSNLDKVNLKIDSTYIINNVTCTVTKIGNAAFSCRPSTETGGSENSEINGKIKTITLPSTVTEIGDDAFCGYTLNTSLTSITGTENVTTIGATAFEKCSLLTTLSFPNVTSIGNGAFVESGLVSITLGGGLTTIPYCCFNGCDMLQYVTGTENVTTISSHSFELCYVLNTLPLSVNKVTSIGDYAFHCCGFDFDFTTLTSCTFGTNATKYQKWNFTTLPTPSSSSNLSKPIPVGTTLDNDLCVKPYLISEAYYDDTSNSPYIWRFSSPGNNDAFVVKNYEGKRPNWICAIKQLQLVAGTYILSGTINANCPHIVIVDPSVESSSASYVLAEDLGNGVFFTLSETKTIQIAIKLIENVSYDGTADIGGQIINGIWVCPKLFNKWTVSYGQPNPDWRYRYSNLTCTWFAFTAAYDILNNVPYTPLEIMALVREDHPEWEEERVVANRTYDNVQVSTNNFITTSNITTQLSNMYNSLSTIPIMLNYSYYRFKRNVAQGSETAQAHCVCIYGNDINGNILVSDSNTRIASILQNQIGGRVYTINPLNLMSNNNYYFTCTKIS